MGLGCQARDFIGDGAHLTRAGAGGDDKVITNRREISQIENDDIRATRVGGMLGGGDREGARRRLPRFDFGAAR